MGEHTKRERVPLRRKGMGRFGRGGGGGGGAFGHHTPRMEWRSEDQH